MKETFHHLGFLKYGHFWDLRDLGWHFLRIGMFGVGRVEDVRLRALGAQGLGLELLGS